MTVRAFGAIVAARLFAQRQAIVYLCAACELVGFLAPSGIEGPVFFGSLIGIAGALLQGPGRQPHLDLCEQSAPLFGRELARAKASVPCILAALGTAAYFAGTLAHGLSPDIAYRFAVTLAAVIPSTLVALSATIRTESARLLYVAMACTASLALYVAAVTFGVYVELAVALPIAFLALRQYGEALARYDPI